ncbi:TerB family tellurite resistance protein [Roseibaca sp. Y0-43]|uniref:tellurite resistance TerB family protein n=1 Tax=Roseibaca sp. Y0-43 TaxID=2816854 RepID=UPI001D0C1105|nr:TerB family tellurite resistance protein [Roseibaca sp. Y0-43]MCC1482341.1 TerB family tellurite resistance protein [Roseibaca sp. Y0-43]
MIGRLFRKPEAPKPDGRVAVAALLVRVARTDGEYAAAEVAVIRDILTRRYGSAELLPQAEVFEENAGDTVHLTKIIKDEIPHDDRMAYLQDLWRVVLADETRDFEEDGFMRLASNLLGMADRDSALARQAVQAEVG